MAWGRNRQNGIKAEGDLLSLLNEDGIFSLPLAPNIAGDIIIPYSLIILEVKRVKNSQTFFPYQPNQVEQYSKLREYVNKGIDVFYAILFYESIKEGKVREKWVFFPYKEEMYKMRRVEGENYASFLTYTKNRVSHK